MSLQVHIIGSDTAQDYTNIAHVNIPSINGELGILPGHVDLVIPLIEGDISWEEDTTYNDIEAYKDHTKHIHIPGGIAYLSQNNLRIIIH